MSIRKTGDWSRVRKLMTQAPARFQKAYKTAFRQEAELLRNHIVEGLTKQSPGGKSIKPLAKTTIARRKMQGFGGSKALLVRGDLRNAIFAQVRGNRAFIGVPRKSKKSKSGNHSTGGKSTDLIDVAKIHEYGKGPFVIPVTPKMRRFLFALLSETGSKRKPSKGGGAMKAVVGHIPARPFLRPAYKLFRKGAQKRFVSRIEKQMLGGRA